MLELRATTGAEFVTRSFPVLRWNRAGKNCSVVVAKAMVIGSAPPSDVQVQDSTVSRMHAELEPTDQGLWLRDLSSKNGTFVDGNRTWEHCIPLGQKQCFDLGRTRFEVDYEVAPQAPVEQWCTPNFHHLVGGSACMRELFALLARVSKTNTSVLIRGETGTGKEAVARSIHDASPRAEGPYIIVDCAAVSDTLLDAELFGHAKGAFTGALHARPGALEAAAGGTVFLDEIGEMPLSMQPKLLRVLEQRAVRRLGEAEYRRVDVRFISATHRDLLSMVARGEFREDLYFRLAVIPVRIPPLRSRMEDIDMLVERFLDGAPAPSDFHAGLRTQQWPGNVRELRNYVERFGALGATCSPGDHAQPPGQRSEHTRDPGPINDVSAPPGLTAEPSPALPPFSGDLKAFRNLWNDYGEREFLRAGLERHGHNVTAFSKEAGVDRTYLHRLLRRHKF